MAETAPYALTPNQDTMPAGDFLVPLCTTAERLHRMLSALKTYEYMSEDRDLDNIIDMLESLAYLDDPTQAPCYPASNCEEDTYSDTFFGLLDEIISNIMSGGIIKAIGYVIDTLGSIIVETAVKVVTVTVVGYLVGGIVSILVGGVLAETVAVGAGEVIDIVFDTGTNTTKIIEFIYEVAA